MMVIITFCGDGVEDPFVMMVIRTVLQSFYHDGDKDLFVIMVIPYILMEIGICLT